MVVIFCNHCFVTKDATHEKFAITNCFHVFCDNCTKNSSAQNFCLLCKKSCKMMAINKDMPAEVRSFFEPNSIDRIFGNIEQISNFANAQNGAYVKKNIASSSAMLKYKKSITDMKAYEAKLDKTGSTEKAIITRLKTAHNSNFITSDLFSLRSPPFGAQQQQEDVSMEVHSGNSVNDVFDFDQL